MDAPQRPSTADEIRAHFRALKRGPLLSWANVLLCWCGRCGYALAIRCPGCAGLVCGTCATEAETLLQTCEPCLTRALARQFS